MIKCQHPHWNRLEVDDGGTHVPSFTWRCQTCPVVVSAGSVSEAYWIIGLARDAAGDRAGAIAAGMAAMAEDGGLAGWAR